MNYKDFDIEISGKQGNEFDIKFSSGASGDVRMKISLERTVDELLDALEGRVIAARGASAARTVTPVGDDGAAPDDEVGEEVGQYLFDVLFSHRDSYRMLAECMTEATGSGSGVRLRLTLNTGDAGVADLARLPWELLYGGEKYKYFARQLGSPIVRYLEVQEKSAVRQLYPPLRIMVVSANPRGDLALDKERDNLKQALSDAVRKERIELTFVESATIKAVADALGRGRLDGRNVHVLHYMGHGDFHNGRGVLLMHKDGGGEDLVDADAFSDALKASEDLRLVFLNACNTAQSSAQKGSTPFGGVATALVRQGVPAVVAMQRPVPDRLAIALAKSFYPNLAEGVPVDAAVSEGRRQMYFEDRNSLDWAIPVLFMRSPDGALFDFAKAAEKLVVVPDPPAPPRQVERPSHPAPLPDPPSGWTWKGWVAAAVGVAALMVAGYAVYGLLSRPGRPSTVEAMTLPSTLEMGAPPVEAKLYLNDAGGKRLEGTSLGKYVVEWLPKSSAVTITPNPITPESKWVGAKIAGSEIGTSPVTITAKLADFPDMVGKWALTVLPSEQAKNDFRTAYFAALKAFNDKAVEDTAVVAVYEQLHKTFPWIDGYVDQVNGFGPGEQAGARKIQETATKLAGVNTAFEQAKKADDPAEGTLAERKKIWEDYRSASKDVRVGSPALTFADGRLASLDELLKTTLSVTEIRTCARANVNLSLYKCTTARSTFKPGEIAFSVEWKAVPKSDRLVPEWGRLGADNRLVEPKTLEAHFGAGHFWDVVTPSMAGTYELRLKDRNGRFVARHRVTVQ